MPPRRSGKKTNLEFILGLTLGLLTPVFAIAILLEYYPRVNPNEQLDHFTQVFLFSRVIIFAVVLNAAVFFAGLRFNRDGLSRGILIACIICVLAVAYLKFFYE